MNFFSVISSIIVLVTIASSDGQKITTIQLEGVQYFISRMNPYTAELNFFLAYQYCRSLGLQLASFETKEKTDSITEFLKNAGYDKYDFWISGNKLGTDMMLWMSTGAPFNATFNYMKKKSNEIPANANGFDLPTGSTSPQRTARESNNGLQNSCVAMKAPSFEWDTDDCSFIKDFICEQTRCYYYNYGPIPVSSSQGKFTTTTSLPSSPVVDQIKYKPMGIKELIDKLKFSTFVPGHTENVDSNTAVPVRDEDVEVEQATNGPYENYQSHSEIMQDDPIATLHRNNDNTDMSTIEPDMVTMFAGSPDSFQ